MIKRILIDIRDFAYHYSKKENGLEYAKTDYLFKVIGFLAFYYIGFTILIVHSAAYFYSARLNEATPLIDVVHIRFTLYAS